MVCFDQEGFTMSNAQKIKMLLAYKHVSESALARLLNTTPQAFNQRLKTDKFTFQEMETIAAALGCTWRAEFVFEDGTTI